MLPHLETRPVFVTRFPGGVEGESFYQKSWPDPPPFVRTVPVWSSSSAAAKPLLLVGNLATLLWLGQQAALELHVWFSRTGRSFDGHGLGTRWDGSEEGLLRSRLNYPDFLVVDLDAYLYSGRERPGDEPELHRAGFERVREVAFEVREVVETLGLAPFVKTSGRTGLHIYVPMLRRFTFEEVRAMAETLGRFLAQRAPQRVTLEWAVDARRGKVFFDYNQNVRGKSLAAAYSPRRHPDATVSTPLRWDELAGVYPTDFTVRTVPARLRLHADPWADILGAKADLEAVLGPVAQAAAG
jgi:bifunctional non-homologous end joining protein LigD